MNDTFDKLEQQRREYFNYYLQCCQINHCTKTKDEIAMLMGVILSWGVVCVVLNIIILAFIGSLDNIIKNGTSTLAKINIPMLSDFQAYFKQDDGLFFVLMVLLLIIAFDFLMAYIFIMLTKNIIKHKDHTEYKYMTALMEYDKNIRKLVMNNK